MAVVVAWPGLALPDVLSLKLGSHLCHVQLRSTLPTHQLKALLQTVRVSLFGHLPLKGCGRLSPVYGTMLTHHHHNRLRDSSDTKSLKESN